MLGKSGADAAALRRHNAAVLQQWERAQAPKGSLATYGPVKLAATTQVSLLSHEPGVLHFTPPYPGVGTWFSFSQVQSDDFLFTGFFVEGNAATGALGHVNQTEIWDDIDDFESSEAIMRSLIGVWVQLPAGTQSVAIYAQLEPISTFHVFNLEDEFWGESNSNANQHSMLFSEFIGVNNSVQSGRGLSFMGGPGGDESEGFQEVHFFQDSGSQWFSWTSSVPQLTPPPNGEWVFAWIGLQTLNHLFVDDVCGLSAVASRWRFKEIMVQPTG
jgi:hypothetical protein